MNQISLSDFWDNNNCKHAFVVSQSHPAGIQYDHSIEDDGDDFCDLFEMLLLGISNNELFFLTGTESGRKWIWDGVQSIKDWNGNTITRLEVW